MFTYLQYIIEMEIDDKNVCIKHKMILFIEIIEELLNEYIKFDKSKDRPLILHAAFLKPNLFRDFCQQFVDCFATKIQWKSTTKVTQVIQQNGKKKSKYIRDKSRANAQQQSFIQCYVT